MDFNPGTLLLTLEHDLATCRMDGIKYHAASFLRESIFKKWIPQDTRSLVDIAIAGFLTANARCRDFVINPDPVLEAMRDSMHRYFNSGDFQCSVLTLTSCLQEGRMGPGASCSTRHTDFFHKMFMGPLSVNSEILYFHYKNNISPRWREAELLRSRAFQVDIVQGSKLSTVPKNAKTNRTICTEPGLNMFYQLGAGEVISKLLKKFHNIDLSLQPDRNRHMAKLGSISGQFATIDLRSASDTISWKLVKYLLPAVSENTLRIIRSALTNIQGNDTELHMISSMGNGFTFPLQTMIFATLVTSVYHSMGIIPKNGHNRNYSVFGDDIICVREAYDEVVRVLGVCGFIVNSEKSFNDGSFRESCGQDFFGGHDVRGVYLKEIKNEQDVYSAFNRLCRWSAKHRIDLTTTLIYLKGLAEFRPVPFDAGDAEGYKCPTDYWQEFIPCRRNRNGAIKYKALVTASNRHRVKPAESDYNFDGCVIAAIGGYIREHSFDKRIIAPELKIVNRVTPSWDHVIDVGLTIQDYQLIWRAL